MTLDTLGEEVPSWGAGNAHVVPLQTTSKESTGTGGLCSPARTFEHDIVDLMILESLPNSEVLIAGNSQA